MSTINKIGTQTITDGYPSVGSIGSSTARPYSLADMDVDSALLLYAIEKKMQMESVLDDCLVDLGQDVVFTGKKVQLPSAAIMRLKTPEKGARTITVPFLKRPSGSPRAGDAEPQQGYERGQNVKFMDAHYNEYSYALAGEEWGINFNDVDKFGLYREIQPQISDYFKELTGQYYREAMLQVISYPLTKSPVSLSYHFNNNWFIANTAAGSQPAYSSTLSTFRTNITNAFDAADTGTNGVNANIDLDYLHALDNYAQNNKRINPLYIDGRKTYFVLLPSPQYTKLTTANDGQLGNIWTQVTQLSDMEQQYPGAAFRVRSLIICEDQRYPTISCTNSYGDNAMTVAYMKPGNSDARNKTVYDASSNASWDIGFLIGANAVIDWEVTPLHFEMEKTEYGKLYGKGAFTERGIELARYKVDTSTAEPENYGTIVLAFTATSIVTTA